MVSWEIAAMAMIGVSSVGFLLSDGERRRVQWVRAMRRCLLRISGMIRYEKPALAELLMRVELRATPQERELSRLFRLCAMRLASDSEERRMGMEVLFAQESAKLAGYGVLSVEDRQPFEAVIGGLGQMRLDEQLRLIDSADERLRQREEVLSRECTRRAQLIRTLGVACGAAVFLILI